MRIRTMGRVGLAAAVIAAVLTQTTGASAESATRLGDGTTSSTAGASCWGIKQEFPESADGVYWLNTAALGAPERYYCDMTTEGGGWVLIGRGRNGFKWDNTASGSRRDLREKVDGPEAFAPVTLAGEEIDRLIGNQPIESLTDGIRLNRAISIDGSVRQEVRMKPQAFGKWSWSWDNGMLLEDISIDGVSYGKSNTRDTANGWAGVSSGLRQHNDEHRILTRVNRNKGWQGGFSLGNKWEGTDDLIRGTSDPESYLWENGTERYPFGFTQIFVRPEIANADAGFTELPAEGLPAEAQPSRLKDRAEVAPWGVVGIDHTNEVRTEPWKTNAMDVHVLGNVMYVGGRFSGVQNGPSAAEVSQPFLAAFAADTGEWIDTFRPELDGRVWKIDSTSDGKLIIGGDFTMVNGNTDATALAALDPATGEVDTSWKADLRNTFTNGDPDAAPERAIVRALTINGNDVYAGGTFTHVTGGDWAEIRVTRAVKLSAADGTPNSSWKPAPNGSVIAMDTTPEGDRVYLAGYFSALNGNEEKGFFAGVDSVNGNPIPGHEPFKPTGGSNAKYQQAVMVDGDHVYVGGSEHNIQKYRLSDNALVGNHVTKQGGDTQALIRWEDDIVVGCHCGDAVFSDTNEWRTPSGHSRVDSVNLVGLFDAEDFSYDTQWNPRSLKGPYGEGPWGFDLTPDGCLVMAGDFDKSGWSGTPENDWLGGFAKFCHDDSTPPTAPTNVQATGDGSTATITFTPGTDDSGTVSHWVYRNDRPIGIAWGDTFVDPYVSEVSRYTVRAVDESRNLSATANFVTVTPQLPDLEMLVAPGSTWSYDDSGVTPQGWTDPWFDDSAWPAGPARLGWEDPTAATVIGANKPTVTYLRHEFNATSAGVDALRLRVLRDDGAVVYLNGTEIARSNLPAGALDANTVASSYVWGSAAETWNEFLVPAELLREGSNTLAVGLHQASAQNGDARFDLQLHTLGSIGDTVAPAPAPTLSGTMDANGANLNWTAAADDSNVTYLVIRDGARVAVTPELGYVDPVVAGSGAHFWQVVAIDSHGNKAWSTAFQGTAAPDANLVALGEEWAWRYDESAPPESGWNAPGFDDSLWARGVGEFGYGDNDETTVISTDPTPRPLVAQFRTTFDVADPAAFSSLLIEAIRDDGINIAINGVDVARDNLPDGAVDETTAAIAGISSGAEERTPIQFNVDSSVLVAGENTIAVSVHNNHRWSGDLSFNLSLTGVL